MNRFKGKGKAVLTTGASPRDQNTLDSPKNSSSTETGFTDISRFSSTGTSQIESPITPASSSVSHTSLAAEGSSKHKSNPCAPPRHSLHSHSSTSRVVYAIEETPSPATEEAWTTNVARSGSDLAARVKYSLKFGKARKKMAAIGGDRGISGRRKHGYARRDQQSYEEAFGHGEGDENPALFLPDLYREQWNFTTEVESALSSLRNFSVRSSGELFDTGSEEVIDLYGITAAPAGQDLGIGNRHGILDIKKKQEEDPGRPEGKNESGKLLVPDATQELRGGAIVMLASSNSGQQPSWRSDKVPDRSFPSGIDTCIGYGEAAQLKEIDERKSDTSVGGPDDHGSTKLIGDGHAESAQGVPAFNAESRKRVSSTMRIRGFLTEDIVTEKGPAESAEVVHVDGESPTEAVEDPDIEAFKKTQVSIEVAGFDIATGFGTLEEAGYVNQLIALGLGSIKSIPLSPQVDMPGGWIVTPSAEGTQYDWGKDFKSKDGVSVGAFKDAPDGSDFITKPDLVTGKPSTEGVCVATAGGSFKPVVCKDEGTQYLLDDGVSIVFGTNKEVLVDMTKDPDEEEKVTVLGPKITRHMRFVPETYALFSSDIAPIGDCLIRRPAMANELKNGELNEVDSYSQKSYEAGVYNRPPAHVCETLYDEQGVNGSFSDEVYLRLERLRQKSTAHNIRALWSEGDCIEKCTENDYRLHQVSTNLEQDGSAHIEQTLVMISGFEKTNREEFRRAKQQFQEAQVGMDVDLWYEKYRKVGLAHSI